MRASPLVSSEECGWGGKPQGDVGKWQLISSCHSTGLNAWLQVHAHPGFIPGSNSIQLSFKGIIQTSAPQQMPE